MMLWTKLYTSQSLLRSPTTTFNTAVWTSRTQFLGRRFMSRSQPTLRITPPRIFQPSKFHSTETGFVFKAKQSPLRNHRRSFHNSPRLRESKPGPNISDTEQSQGLSARLRKLSREYGWTAVGVYLGLSVLDFPFCFLLVRIVGVDRVGEIEHVVVSYVKKLIPESVRERWNEYRKALKEAEKEEFGNDEISEHVEMAGWGVEEAEKRHKAEASLGTQLALAYAIHKSFIFIRVPLTAAILPKVVKVLRSWGWDIGKRKAKR